MTLNDRKPFMILFTVTWAHILISGQIGGKSESSRGWSELRQLSKHCQIRQAHPSFSKVS